ncbi:cell adhesion molecule CEACAM16 [Carettochelys insculpta]|uniref:cell adhesion molecule CEACAM16 n=1 Tax=Carettochelys insculpta TaxID=44489 RepID=UPI003EBD7020
MGCLQASPHARTRATSRTAPILAACALLSCLPLAGALRFGVAVVPPHPAAGQTVTLLVGGARGVAQSCTWYRRTSTAESDRILTFTAPTTRDLGPASTGRESLGRDCSLHIVGVTPQDSGAFTLHICAHGRTHALFVRLQLAR